MLQKDGNLWIKYNDNTDKEARDDNPELKKIKSFLQNHDKNFITRHDLEKKQNQQEPNNKSNYWPWIISGSIVIGALIIGLFIYFALKKKKNKDEEED